MGDAEPVPGGRGGQKALVFQGFSEDTQSPDDLPDMVARLLRQNALSSLSLAKKAGEAVTGS